MHEGHRNRLKEKLKKFGPDFLADHELLELDLFYAIPVKNTNDIAHRLLNRFGSLMQVYSASIEDLLLVDGVGEKTALYLKKQGYIHNRLLQEKTNITNNKNNCIENFNAVVNLIKAKFFGLNDEHFLLMLADRQRRINFCEIIFKGNPETVNIDVTELIRKASEKHSKFAIIAHNHPSGLVLPSPRDLETTEQLKQAFSLIGVNLLDHFIITIADCVSLSGCGLI